MRFNRPIKEDTRLSVRAERPYPGRPMHQVVTPFTPDTKTPDTKVPPPPTPVPTPKVPPTPTPVPTPIPRGAAGGKVVSASKRADGCAQRGKTKGKMY